MMTEYDDAIGFMCLIDFQHELGSAADGTRVFPSMAALRTAHPMIDDCGAVQVRVSVMRRVIKGMPLGKDR
jgi:hypothetical protein